MVLAAPCSEASPTTAQRLAGNTKVSQDSAFQGSAETPPQGKAAFPDSPFPLWLLSPLYASFDSFTASASVEVTSGFHVAKSIGPSDFLLCVTSLQQLVASERQPITCPLLKCSFL